MTFSLAGGLLLIDMIFFFCSILPRGPLHYNTMEPISLEKWIWFRLACALRWSGPCICVCVQFVGAFARPDPSNHLESCVSRVHLKAEPSPVSMPTHFTARHCVYLNEFIFKLMFAFVFTVSCVHTLNSCGVEAFPIAKSDLGEIAYWFWGEHD